MSAISCINIELGHFKQRPGPIKLSSIQIYGLAKVASGRARNWPPFPLASPVTFFPLSHTLGIGVTSTQNRPQSPLKRRTIFTNSSFSFTLSFHPEFFHLQILFPCLFLYLNLEPNQSFGQFQTSLSLKAICMKIQAVQKHSLPVGFTAPRSIQATWSYQGLPHGFTGVKGTRAWQPHVAPVLQVPTGRVQNRLTAPKGHLTLHIHH